MSFSVYLQWRKRKAIGNDVSLYMDRSAEANLLMTLKGASKD